MGDVSSNDEIEIEFDHIENEEIEIENSEDVSSNDYFPEHIPDDLHGHESYVMESETAYTISSDYSSYLENIDTTIKFQTAILIGFLLLVGFIIGWKND